MASPVKGDLVVFQLKKGLSGTERTKFCRDVWGYEEHSQFSKYRYRRPGLLSDIPHVRLTRGVILVARTDTTRVVGFLRKGAKVQTRVVHLTPADRRKLGARRSRKRGS